MNRTGPWENERLARVVKNYMEHLAVTRLKDPRIGEIVRMAIDVDIWEMWVLTQERSE